MRKIKCITKAKSRLRKDIKNFITIVILAENHGYRMKSHGPISLFKIGGKTLLEHQIEVIKSCFLNYEIVICTGFESSKLSNFIRSNIKDNIRIVENQIHNNTNCCESIRLCLNNITNSRVFIQQSNVLFSADNYSSIDYDRNSIITQRFNRNSVFDVSALDVNSELKGLCLGLKDEFWVENIYLSNRNSINKFYDIVSSINYKNKFLFEAINDFSDKNKIQVYKNEEKEIIKYNNIKTLKEIHYENFNTKF